MSPRSDTDEKLGADQRAREAEIATGDSDGEPLGACIYLTPSDLEELGVNPTKADHLSYVVEDGQLDIMESEKR